MIEIRKATLEDAAAIVPLWKQLMDQHHEIHRIFQLVEGSADGLVAAMQSILTNDKTAVFVASVNAQVIGFAMASLSRRPPQFILGLRGSISDIFVEEAYRKAGVATQLVAHSKQWLLSNGVEYIDMQVTVDNTAAMRFWEKQGFGTVNHYMVMNDTSITIRNANVQDAGQIAYVHINTWRTTYTGIVPEAYLEQMELKARTEMWERILAQRSDNLFVAELHGVVVGFATAGEPSEDKGYDGELYAIYILQAQQKKRIGDMLFDAAVNYLKGKGNKSMYLWVLEENPATEFYKYKGGVPFDKKEIELGGKMLMEVGYGWEI